MTETLHPEEVVTAFLLVRHGHTTFTEEGKLYTDPQAQLTDCGLKQAQALAAWVSKQGIELLLSSPAKRVVQTAEIIGARSKLTPVIVPSLDEWRIGDWEGRSYLDLKKNDPKQYTAWSIDPIRNRPPDGESIEDLVERSSRSLFRLLSLYEGKKIALVTHAGIIRSIVVHALKMPVDNFWRISVPVGSVSHVDFSKNFATVHFLSLVPNSRF